MDLGLDGRVALVLGASRGLGRAVAAELGQEGARVALAARSRERVDEAAAAVGGRGYVHDVSDLDAVDELVAAVEHDLGPIEVLVTNTGGPPPNADALGFTREQWEAAYRSLVLGPMALVERVLPGMRERGFGRVVNIVSTVVREPSPVLMLSQTHRSATVAAFKTISRQVAADGVTLNSVLPGRILTDRLIDLAGSQEAAEAAGADIPAGRLGTPEEFAAAVAFLCSARASYITGVSLAVDGGALLGICPGRSPARHPRGAGPGGTGAGGTARVVRPGL